MCPSIQFNCSPITSSSTTPPHTPLDSILLPTLYGLSICNRDCKYVKGGDVIVIAGLVVVVVVKILHASMCHLMSALLVWTTVVVCI